MTQQRTNALPTTRAVLLTVRALVLIIGAVFYAGCNENQITTNQPPPTTANTPGAQQQSTATPEQPTGERRDWNSEVEAKKYMASVFGEEKEKEKKERLVDGHDEPIIITDGSLHIKTYSTEAPPPTSLSFRDDFDASADNTKLTRKKVGRVYLVYIVTHPTTTTTLWVTYRFSGNAHSEVVVAYKDLVPNHPADDFLTVTTRAGGEKLVIRSPHVPFSNLSGWNLNDPRHWIYEENRHHAGHLKVTETSDVANQAQDDEFPEAKGESYVEYHIFVPDIP